MNRPIKLPRLFQGAMVAGWLLLGMVIGISSLLAEPERIHLHESTIEERIVAGRDIAWVLRRRSYSFRGQTTIDGIIVAEPKTALRLKVIRRKDGDHQVLLGPDGDPGNSIASLQGEITQIRREHLLPHPVRSGDRILATFYAPHGAWPTVSPYKNGAVLIELELPWEKERFPVRQQLLRK